MGATNIKQEAQSLLCCVLGLEVLPHQVHGTLNHRVYEE